MITILARLKSNPGKEAELAEVCSQLAKEVQAKEEGCLMYLPHVASKNPSEIIVIEKYKDKQALEIHSKSDYFKAAGTKFKELLVGPAEIRTYKEL